MNETTERFFQDIASRIGRDRIAEVHLFPAIRQGGMESGIAVVAAELEVVPPENDLAENDALADDEILSVDAEASGDVDDEEFEDSEFEDDEEFEEDEFDDDDELEDDELGDDPGDDELDDDELDDDELDNNAASDLGQELGPIVPAYTDATGESAAEEDAISEDAVATVVALERHVVYTARYRVVLKGPDRGKWEMDVKAEADAPLITVDEVVRGVVRRSGDDTVPERLSGEQFRAIVPPPAGSASEPASPVPGDTPPADTHPA